MQPRIPLLALLTLLTTGIPPMAQTNSDRIQPDAANPRYWQYQGRPVLLLGGTVKDCLFQIPDLEAHLDLLQQVGGNYIRNTMSDRPTDGYEIKAFHQRDDGLYDLDQWNPAYWQRFADLLRWTAARDIVVQIELWDRFDHSTQPWESDPFNPVNNINYSPAEAGLEATYPEHPGGNKQPFFYSVPALANNQILLPYQQAFIDRVLEHTLSYDHVLYCMDNETSGDPEWGAYWNAYIKKRAQSQDKSIETTEMWDQWDVRGDTHRATFDHPETYSFIDISQNTWQHRQANWDHAQWVRQYIAAHPRPINSTKIYGAQTHQHRDQRGVDDTHATQCFWRNLIGGFASSRFHRPPSGIGLSPLAQAHIRSGRLLADAFDFFNAEPDADSALLQDRADNEAYLSRVAGRQYALYFTDGGQVGLDLGGAQGPFHLQWLDIVDSTWQDGPQTEGGAVVQLDAPGEGPWVALLTRE
ncbi:MAG: hypothetical protein GKR89_17555 [Candidatus Latescibacteria bacterium]|nr:hypothetical protein [Candidatus Latescibacterota bacterium]